MAMLAESSMRRRDFLPGSSIRLADGQEWTFPAPPGHVAPAATAPGGNVRFGPDYNATVAAVCEAEDHFERLRAELALAICLLDRNYDLTPDALWALLGYPPGDPALAAMQGAFHRVAQMHVCQSRPWAESVSPARRPAKLLVAS